MLPTTLPATYRSGDAEERSIPFLADRGGPDLARAGGAARGRDGQGGGLARRGAGDAAGTEPDAGPGMDRSRREAAARARADHRGGKDLSPSGFDRAGQ